MLLDIGPLRTNFAFRRLFVSQFVSGLGTMVSCVAVPWQLYELTRSNAQVGLLGLLLAQWGAVGAYVFDFATFVVALVFIGRIPREAVGTYIVDIVAMTFAFPVALFPAMAQAAGQTQAVGWLLSAMSVGVPAAIWTGGAICLAGVVATGLALPRFWAYRSSQPRTPAAVPN